MNYYKADNTPITFVLILVQNLYKSVNKNQKKKKLNQK